jgi:predicted nucleic acid-binding Zn ribbon protein
MSNRSGSRARKQEPARKQGLSQEQRSRRRTQILFIILAAIIILSWVISLVARY